MFTKYYPRSIALSLKRSAEVSNRRKSDPYRSAMSMLTFYINRGGRTLPEQQRDRLEAAKDELRALFDRPRRHRLKNSARLLGDAQVSGEAAMPPFPQNRPTSTSKTVIETIQKAVFSWFHKADSSPAWPRSIVLLDVPPRPLEDSSPGTTGARGDPEESGELSIRGSFRCRDRAEAQGRRPSSLSI